jgi:hypothetical protein
MPRVRRKQTKNQRQAATAVQQAIPLDDGTVTTPAALAMIRASIPLGLRAVEEALLAEVTALAGPRYARHDERPAVVRWGAQPGSIFLADQQLPVLVPRVRTSGISPTSPMPRSARELGSGVGVTGVSAGRTVNCTAAPDLSPSSSVMNSVPSYCAKLLPLGRRVVSIVQKTPVVHVDCVIPAKDQKNVIGSPDISKDRDPSKAARLPYCTTRNGLTTIATGVPSATCAPALTPTHIKKAALSNLVTRIRPSN